MKPYKALTLFSFFAALLAIATPSQANVVGRLGIDGGGDKLLSFQFTNGDSSSIKAGSGVFFEIGYALPTPGLDNPAASTEVTFGYKNDSENASNGEVDFTRLSINVNQMLTLEKFRVGAGLSYHFKNKLKTSGSFLGSNSVEFDESLGFTLLVEYMVSDTTSLGLRANFIDYSVDGTDIDGNGFGIYVQAGF